MIKIIHCHVYSSLWDHTWVYAWQWYPVCGQKQTSVSPLTCCQKDTITLDRLAATVLCHQQVQHMVASTRRVNKTGSSLGKNICSVRLLSPEGLCPGAPLPYGSYVIILAARCYYFGMVHHSAASPGTLFLLTTIQVELRLLPVCVYEIGFFVFFFFLLAVKTC